MTFLIFKPGLGSRVHFDPAPALAQNRPALTGSGSYYQKGEGKGKKGKTSNFSMILWHPWNNLNVKTKNEMTL